MTRFIYALKEIRACLEAEILTDVQQRLALLSRDMDNHNGHRVAHQPPFAAVDLIEQRSQQNRPLKIVKVRCGFREDRDAAEARHFAAHPEDRDANIMVFEFYDDRELADESQDRSPPSGANGNSKTAAHDAGHTRQPNAPR